MSDENDLYKQLGIEVKQESSGLEDISKAAGKSGLASLVISGAGKALQLAPYAPAKVVGKFLSAAPMETAVGSAAGGAAGEFLKQKGMPLPIQIGGEMVASFGPTMLRAGGRKLYESVLGAPSQIAENLLPRAKEIGLQLDPKQLRAEGGRRVSYAGATPEISFKNQTAVNREASKATGKEVEEVTPKFIGERMDTVGGQIGDVIRGPKNNPKSYVVTDPSEFNQILQRELDVNNPAFARTSTLITSQILQKAKQVDPITGAITKEAEPITGEVLQRLRSELGRVIRTSTDRSDAYVAAETINAIDSLVASQLTGAEKQALEKLRPQYRAAATLDLLTKRGGIDNGQVSAERLGKLLRQKDYKYTQGTSTHPLAELGQIGETYNLRSIQEKPEIPASSRFTDIARFTKNAALLAAPLVGGFKSGPTGGIAGTAASLGYASAEELAKALARSRGATLIQTKLGPTMRQAPESYVSPAAKAIAATELTKRKD
jgi:hypothetical protein